MTNISGSEQTLTPIEQTIANSLEAGEAISLDNLGGWGNISENLSSLQKSPLVNEVLRSLLDELQVIDEFEVTAEYHSLLIDLIAGITTDFVLIEVVDLLDEYLIESGNFNKLIHKTFMKKVVSVDCASLSKATALDGAFRRVLVDERLRFSLINGLIESVESCDDFEYLLYATKIVGVAYSHWKEPELIDVLKNFRSVDELESDINLELGLLTLEQALSETDADQAMHLYHNSQRYFICCTTSSDGYFEAAMYQTCLYILTAYDELSLSEIEKCVGELERYVFYLLSLEESQIPWLGARNTQSLYWANLAREIFSLREYIDEISWYEPKFIIEQHLISIYTAGRSILKRSKEGSVERILQPYIESKVASSEAKLHVLKCWLRQNHSHKLYADMKVAVSNIENIEHQPQKTPLFPENINLGDFEPTKTSNLVNEVISNAHDLYFANLSAAEKSIIEDVIESVKNHPDYATNCQGRSLFNSILLFMVRFIFNRIELSRKDDPTSAYLFENSDGTLPLEDDLQSDYFRWLSTHIAGSQLEPTNVAGGRADVALKGGSERIAIEVKREMKDASFDGLEKRYFAQSADYQNVSVRLGFMLVLDLATPNREGTPHITELFAVRKQRRNNEVQPRHIVIVKVPGRRLRPSELSKNTKPS